MWVPLMGGTVFWAVGGAMWILSTATTSGCAQLLCDHPDRYQFFQFSILQLLPKTATDEEVIHTESLWKKKLLSIPFGMNDN